MLIIPDPVEIRESDVPISSKNPKDIEVTTQEGNDLIDHENPTVNRVRIEMD